MSKDSKEIYEFGPFRLEVSERRLLRNGKVLRVAGKAFETLCVLVRRHGELVTKDKLLSSVWPDSVVEENNLDQKISLLRGILGERHGGKEKFIETVRGHGYRFVPQVDQVVEAAEHSPAEKERRRQIDDHAGPRQAKPEVQRMGNLVAVSNWGRQIAASSAPRSLDERQRTSFPERSDPPFKAHVPGRSVRSRFRFLIAAAILLSVLGFGLYAYIGVVKPPPAIESIAILPIANQTGDQGLEYLSDGLTESMISGISQVPNLSVKGRTSVFRYKGREIEPESVGRELSVQAVLIGSLSRGGDRFVLGLELVEASTGNVVWSERYDRERIGMIALQGEIVRDVSESLRSRLTDSEKTRIARTYTADPEASSLFQQARYHLNKRTPEDIRKSISLFEQAARRDPSYAKAFAGLAEAHIILPDYSPAYSRLEVKDAEQRSRAAFLRARELDDSLPEVQVLAAAHSEIDWDVAGADRAYRRAIELDPDFATARHWYSRFLGAVGRNDEAITQISKALELDPYSRSIAFNLGARFYDARRFDDAITQFKRVLEMEPNHSLTRHVLGLAYDAKGMHREAIDEFRVAGRLFDPTRSSLAGRRSEELIAALQSRGSSGYWGKRLEHARLDHQEGSGSNYKISVCLARLGETDRAFHHLEQAFAAREPDLFWIRTESAFDRLSTDRRFLALLRRVGVA